MRSLILPRIRQWSGAGAVAPGCPGGGRATGQHDERTGAPDKTVIERLLSDYKDPGSEELIIVALGLVAGTVGNVCAAVSIAIADFFAERDRQPPLIDKAREAARSTNWVKLRRLIEGALVRNLPAPFLARTSTGERTGFKVKNDRGEPIPEGAHLVLALGAAADCNYIFGGSNPSDYPHRCIGQHLAWPLTLEIVRQVLLLPGLSQVIDPISGKPEKLKKRWGAICKSYPMQFQRDRRLNLKPLHLVLPIKKPIEENAKKLLQLTQAGAPLIEEALGSGGVCSAKGSSSPAGRGFALSEISAKARFSQESPTRCNS
jgi:hypothetical protein